MNKKTSVCVYHFWDFIKFTYQLWLFFYKRYFLLQANGQVKKITDKVSTTADTSTCSQSCNSKSFASITTTLQHEEAASTSTTSRTIRYQAEIQLHDDQTNSRIINFTNTYKVDGKIYLYFLFAKISLCTTCYE